MSVPSYLFHSLSFKLSNKEMSFSFSPLRLCLVECKIFFECKIFLGENIFGKGKYFHIFGKGKYFQVFGCIMKIVLENVFMCLVAF